MLQFNLNPKPNEYTALMNMFFKIAALFIVTFLFASNTQASEEILQVYSKIVKPGDLMIHPDQIYYLEKEGYFVPSRDVHLWFEEMVGDSAKLSGWEYSLIGTMWEFEAELTGTRDTRGIPLEQNSKRKVLLNVEYLSWDESLQEARFLIRIKNNN